MKRIYLAIAALLGLLALTACGSSGSSGTASSRSNASGASSSAATNTAAAATSGTPASSSPGTTNGGSLVVGSAAFPESELLANIYAEALKAKGVQATTKLDIGERAIYLKALSEGSIDFFPEYSGSLLSFLDPKATAKKPADVYAALQKKAIGTQLTVFKYAPAQDSDTITVTKATAAKYNLKSIGDLAPVAGKLTLGAPAQFQTRPDGIPALKSVYGVTFGRFTKLGTAGTITVNALKNNTIDAADIFSTDSSIVKNGFVSLQDPKSMFAAQNIVPVVNKAKATPAIQADCNAVSAKLDTATLAALVAKVANGNSAQVAKTWLTSVGLG